MRVRRRFAIEGSMNPGAEIQEGGVAYGVWAPGALWVEARVEPVSGGAPRQVRLRKDAAGYHQAVDPAGRPGDAYGFCLEGGPALPDPWSRAQRDGVHGLSLVVDARTYHWNDAAWARPPFRDLVLYEMHIGTFTREGTFRAAQERLGHLAALGISAIELMPVADFPGAQNWGYDGVLIYAPARCYGTPDDLRALVDAAHARGIAVILDVVYNHFGPDGNYLAQFSPDYFSGRHRTPWGDGFNFEAEHVRRFFLENPAYWMEEFHIDGFRFDATHEIRDDTQPHLLAEMTARIHERGGYAMAEDSRNEARVISRDGLGFDAVWADDFHHAARVGQTGEGFSYLQDFSGTVEEVADILRNGWLYRGQPSRFRGQPRGTSCQHLPPSRFIHCLSNHDQTGNRALGERLHHLISPQAYRALSMLLCLTPYTPLLFMGQEWAASAPFLFFTDHKEDLGRQITRGRRKEFSSFPEFSDPSRIPDPQDTQTFRDSKLNWGEIREPAHGQVLRLYSECLRLRRKRRVFRPDDRMSWSADPAGPNASAVRLANEEYALFANLGGPGAVVLPGDWELVLSSEEVRFGGPGATARSEADGTLHFPGPEALLFRSLRGPESRE